MDYLFKLRYFYEREEWNEAVFAETWHQNR